jgi:hypothetical protein
VGHRQACLRERFDRVGIAPGPAEPDRDTGDDHADQKQQ